MRKIYETEIDRQNESNVARYLETAWNCTFKKSVALSNIDGEVFGPDGRLAALIEIKKRLNSSTRYPTLLLSANKWRNALRLSEECCVPFMLVVEFTDGIFVTKIKKEYPVQKGGRYDRGDSMDLEDCVYIPMSDFKRV
jgi:hypothetical protein